MATHSPTQFSMATAVYNKLEEGDQVDYCDDWYETVLTYDVITREIDKKDFSRYIKYKRKVYAEEDICDDDLAEVFHEDFKLFTKNEFATVHQLDARQLRKTLRIKGLNITMSGADAQSGLYEQAQRTNSVPWTMEQAKEIMKGDDFNTIKFSSKKIEKMIKDGNERDDDNPPDDDDDPDDEDGRGGRNSRGNRRERSNDGKDRKNSPYVPNALLNLQKFYSPDEKYEGDDDNFDYKLSIFYEIARRAELPTEQFYQAFPMMLKGSALSFYHSSRDDLPDTFKSLCEYMKQEFEGVQYERNMLAQWNAITLTTVRKSNKDKTLGESFNIMAKELRSLQMRLQKEMRDPIHMHNKLMLACQGVPACDFACFNPAKDVPGFIQQLKQAIATWEKSHKTEDSTFFVDRRFRNNDSNYTSRGSSSYSPNRNTQSSYSRNNSPDTRAPQGRNNNFVRKCWICKKEGCRSTKHTPQEQEEHKQKWRNRFITGSNNSFKKRYDQWLVEVEGEEEDSDRDQEMATFFSGLDIEDQKEEDSFFTSSGPVDGRKVVEKLATCALQHALFGEKAYGKADGKAFEEAFHTSEKYSDKEFFGICIDTGAARRSTVGNGQFKAWQKVSDAVIDTSRAGAANVKFGKGEGETSIGSVNVSMPFGVVEFHILQTDTPFLLSLTDMDRLKIAFDNRVNILHTPDGEFPVYRRNDHPFLLWKINFNGFIQDSIQRNECYLTDVDLRQLHRRFGHPSARKFHKVLQRAGYDESHSAIKHLTKYCEHCQLHGKSPGRFKFSLQDDTEFNHTILVDVMYIANQPILHIVDEATRYQAARWLENMTAKNAWDALRACWIDVYVGPPDYIVHDAGKNFFSKEFTQNATSMAIATKCVPVEAHNSIGLVERYHKPLKRAYHIINEEMSGFELAKDMILQMAVKAINDTVGPDGIVPTLLVYGTYPRMTTIDAPAATIVKRANAIKKAMAEIRRINARRQVSDALRMRNGPSTSAIHGLPVNSEVLVWREGKGTGSGKWTGPHILLRMEGETCTVELSSGPTDFRSTSVKPFYTEPEDDDDATGEEEEVVFQGAFRSSTPPADRPNLQLRHKLKSNLKNEISMVKDTPQISAFLQDDDTEEDVNIDEFDEIFVNNSDPTSAYVESRRKEIDGLMENKVFKIIPESEVPPGTRIFTSKFVDEMKNEGTEKAFPKSRLVVQAYKDGDKTSVLTQSPTIQRVSQRIIISLAATMRVSSPGISVYLRDITQAYTQSTTNLNRVFYVRAPKEFGLEKGFILHVVKPLYGVPEAGNHWFNTYHGHHKGRLKMEQSTYDPCLLHTNRMGFGIVGLQTDDTLIVADKEFARSEQEQLEKAHFMAKDREKLREGMPLKFNGGLITLKNDHIYLNQEKQCDNMRTVQSGKMDISGTRGKKRKDVTSKNQYVAQRARGAYIATVCQPEASYHLSVAAQVVDPKEDDTKKLNKVLKWQMSNQSRGLNFVPLDIDSIKLTVFTDASFANNLDFSSQIGHVTCLVDKYDNANIIHWASIKCKRITRSVLASELYGLVFGFDVGAAIKGSINAIIKPKKQIPLVICIDSKSLYELLTKLGTTAEKRLMIDIMSLRQSYERREITEIKWIDGNSNPADAMTKDRPCQALKDLIDTNKLIIKESQWVERGD